MTTLLNTELEGTGVDRTFGTATARQELTAGDRTLWILKLTTNPYGGRGWR